MVSCEKYQEYKPIDMPVCEHFVPVKFACERCWKISVSERLDKLDNINEVIKDLINENQFLKKRIEHLQIFESEWRSMPRFDLAAWMNQQEERIDILETSIRNLFTKLSTENVNN